MPLTAARMLAVIEAAEHLTRAYYEAERFTLFRPPELNEALSLVNRPDSTIDDGRKAVTLLIGIYEGLIDRVRENFRPNLGDYETIVREAEHFRTAGKRNKRAAERMQKMRQGIRADLESGETPRSRSKLATKMEFQHRLNAERGTGQEEISTINAKYWPNAPAPMSQADDETGDALSLSGQDPQDLPKHTELDYEADAERRRRERELRDADATAPLIPRQR